jgi:hypothetical protein
MKSAKISQKKTTIICANRKKRLSLHPIIKAKELRNEKNISTVKQKEKEQARVQI